MRRWLARLSFSFLILAAVLVWEARKAKDRGESPTRHYIAAALLAGAGMAGMRERHRPS
jgi:hypothetical protein